MTQRARPGPGRRALFGSLLMAVLFVSLACNGSGNDGSFGLPDLVETLGDGAQEPVTYSSQMKELLDRRCTMCHASALKGAARHGASDKYNYDTYELASEGAARGNQKVKSGFMPIDPSSLIPSPLSSNEKQAFQAWVDQGTLP